jgi:SNF2 family DNA or RNA helicase
LILDVQQNIIQISLIKDDLKKYQISQLIFYGFSSLGNRMQLKTDELNRDILKIVNYFQQEKINFTITDNLSKILTSITTKKEKLAEVFNLGKKIKDGIIEKSSFDEFNEFLKTLPRKLKTHQTKAAYHLYSIKNGANFSVPGSGKTSVVISVYEKLKLEGKCNLIFVVGPPSSFQPWQREFYETTGRKIETSILSGGSKSKRKSEYYNSALALSELYLSTFQTLMNDYLDVIKLLNQNGVNVFFVVDEAHYMKQIGGSWANSLLQVAKHTQYRCILTGTPMPKSYIDVFNLFDFLWLSDSPLTDEDKININIYEKNKKNEEVRKILKDSIGPLFYRVRKNDLGLKAAVFHKPIIIKMNVYENKIYELLSSKIYELSKNDFFENQNILTKLWKGRMMRMRQSTSYPKLLLNSIEDYKEDIIEENSELLNIIRDYDNLELPSKLEYLIAKVTELKKTNQKVLIWSNFIGTIDLLKAHFKSLNYKCEVIYGKTPTKKRNYDDNEKTRDEIRDIFVDSNSGLDILIANPAACAESISLHQTCFHAIYYDLSYNCAQYLQSLDRIHRVGGSEFKTANYYFLQYEDSVDQDIKSNLDKKAQKMYDIVDEDYEIYNLDMLEDTFEDDFDAYKRIFKPELN